MDKLIYESLKRAYNFVADKGYNVFVITLYGSQNYGLDTPDSDLDYKAIVIPSIDDVILNRNPASTSYEFEGGLIDVKDIRLMFDNYKKQNLNFIETLFTPYYWVNEDYKSYWAAIKRMADDIARADPERALKAMYGMALQKQNALCHPYPSKLPLIEKYGYDGKQLSHIYRICYICMEYIGNPNKWYGNYLIFDDDSHKTVKQYIINLKTYQISFDVDTAKKKANDKVQEIKNLVDDAIRRNNYTVRSDVYKKLDAFKANIIKKSFSKELHS